MKHGKTRRAFLKTMAASVCTGGLSLPVYAAAQEATIQGVDSEANKKRPNILLMIAEDMSWKDWGVRLLGGETILILARAKE